jgi:hypothetical protein
VSCGAWRRTKEEFFASVSHELRSPLTSIREGAHLLGERVSGPLTDKQRRLVEIIAAGADRLLGLVNQILGGLATAGGRPRRSSGSASTSTRSSPGRSTSSSRAPTSRA